MEDWEVTALFLFVFGLLKEFKPSEPFFMEYAIDDKHFTTSYMIHTILPITTYAGLPILLIILLVTDFLRYKPIIVFGALCSVLSWAMVIWTYDHAVFLVVRQVAEAVSKASEIAYHTYMYANVDHSHYKIVTSLNHAALHTGKFFGSLTGQLLISQASMSVFHLNYVTLGGVSLALLSSLLLPKVKRSIYFRSRKSIAGIMMEAEETSISAPPVGEQRYWSRVIRAKNAFWHDMWTAYSNRYILRWSLWWSIAMAIHLQVGLYTESLWRHIEEETEQTIYNGYIDATQALTSAILGMCVAYVKIPWMKFGELYLTGISFVLGGALIFMSQAHNLYLNYANFILFQTLFQVMIIVVTAEVAEGVNESSEAFIFGLNTVFAVLLQMVLTVVTTSDFGLIPSIRDEFVVYGVCSCVLGLVFLIIALQSRRQFFELSRRNERQREMDHAHELASRMASITVRKSSIASIR